MSSQRRVAAVLAVVAMLTTGAPTQAAWPPDPAIEPDRVVEELFEAVRRTLARDPDAGRRAWAWRTLARANDRYLAVMLPAGLADPSPGVRAEALRAVTSVVYSDGDERRAARETVASALASSDPALRWAAAKVIENRSSYGGNDDVVWNDVSVGIGLLDDSLAIREICQAAIEEGETFAGDVRSAYLSLARFGSPESRLWALQRATSNDLKDPRWLDAVRAAETADSRELRLAMIGDCDCDQKCARLLTDPDPVVRARVFVDRLLTGAADVPALVTIGLKDADRRVVALAARYAWDVNQRCRIEAKPLQARAADLDDEQGDSSAALAWRVLAESAAAGELDEATLRGDALDAVWSSAVELGRVSRGADAKLTTSERQAKQAASLATLARLAGALDSPDPLVRRAVVSALGEACCWVGRERGGARLAALRDVWEQVFARLKDDDARVRRAAVRQMLAALDRAAYPGRLRHVEEWLDQALVDADPIVARLAATTFPGNRWRPEAAPVLKGLLDEPNIDPRDWNLRFERLIIRAPDLFGDDEVAAIAAGKHGAANEWSERLAVEALLKRQKYDEVVKLTDVQQGEWAEKDARRIVALSLTRRSAAGRASDVVLPKLDPSRANALFLCLQDYWSEHDRVGQGQVTTWAAAPSAPAHLRCAALEACDDEYQWNGEAEELDTAVLTALESDDPLVAAQAFLTVAGWHRSGHTCDAAERSERAQKLHEAMLDWIYPSQEPPDSL